MNYVFVYGSLKKGCSNSQVMDAAGGTLVDAAWLHGASLYNLGYYPGLKIEGDGTVQGEVYLVSRDGLRRLDRLEGHPNFYHRVEVEVRSAHGARKVWVYTFPHEVEPRQRIEDGIWKEREW